MESIYESLSIFTKTFFDHIDNEFEIATVQTASSSDIIKHTNEEITLGNNVKNISKSLLKLYWISDSLESLKISDSMRCNSCDIDLSNRDEQVNFTCYFYSFSVNHMFLYYKRWFIIKVTGIDAMWKEN